MASSALKLFLPEAKCSPVKTNSGMMSTPTMFAISWYRNSAPVRPRSVRRRKNLTATSDGRRHARADARSWGPPSPVRPVWRCTRPGRGRGPRRSVTLPQPGRREPRQPARRQARRRRRGRRRLAVAHALEADRVVVGVNQQPPEVDAEEAEDRPHDHVEVAELVPVGRPRHLPPRCDGAPGYEDQHGQVQRNGSPREPAVAHGSMLPALFGADSSPPGRSVRVGRWTRDPSLR